MSTPASICMRLQRRAILAAFVWLLTTIALVGCDTATSDAASGASASSSAPTQPKPLRVVATTAMVGDIVHSVAAKRADVRVLMGAGVDPHLYRPTRDDVQSLLNADIIFYNGLNLEGKMADTFIRVARSGKRVFAVTELLPDNFLLAPEEFEGHDDPHVWMDPNGWRQATKVVIDALREVDPDGADTFRTNGERYLAELKQLDDWSRERLETIPSSRRVLVTAHDAFNYFARAYGFEVLGIQGISTDSEAGLQRIESLVNTLVTRRIPAVFTESSVSDRHIRALIDGAKARGHEVRIGGELFSDAMGAGGTYEGTYIGMIDHNITTIVRALGGQVPEGGMNGQLRETTRRQHDHTGASDHLN